MNTKFQRLALTFYWKTIQIEPRDINLFVDFMDQNGKIIDRQFRPLCYRIWPTQAWSLGQGIEEHQYFSLSPALSGRLKYLEIGFFDFNSGKLIHTDSNEALTRIKIVWHDPMKNNGT